MIVKSMSLLSVCLLFTLGCQSISSKNTISNLTVPTEGVVNAEAPKDAPEEPKVNPSQPTELTFDRSSDVNQPKYTSGLTFELPTLGQGAPQNFNEPLDLFGEGGPLAKGSIELSFDFSYTNQAIDADGADIDLDILNQRIGIGYYIQDGLELGVDLQTMFIFVDADGTDSEVLNFFLNLAPKYNFQIDSEWIVPYVGGNIGFSVSSTESGTYDETEAGFLIGGALGVKFFPAKNYNVFFEYDINGIFFSDITTLSNSVALGISFYF